MKSFLIALVSCLFTCLFIVSFLDYLEIEEKIKEAEEAELKVFNKQIEGHVFYIIAQNGMGNRMFYTKEYRKDGDFIVFMSMQYGTEHTIHNSQIQLIEKRR